MSDGQKIWFIYLTDHHEGPFTAEEIAEKASAGLVNGKSLAWKDGMADWVPAETIPELAPAFGGAPAAESPAPGGGAEAAAAGEGGVSLAELLAQSQGGSGAPVVETETSAPTSVIASLSSPAPAGQSGIASMTASFPANEPGPSDEVWTLKVGSQVTGLYSMNKLKELAAGGGVPGDAMIWHSGWSDFQPVSAVAELAAVKKVAGGGSLGSRTGFMRPGVAITAAPSDDEPTDTGIEAPPKGFKGFLAKIKNFTASFKKKKAATASAAPAKGKVALAAAPAKGKANGAKASGGGRKLVPLLLGLLVGLGAAGGGAYYYLFLMSPIPSGIDVSPGDREVMIEVVKQKEGHRLFLAQATGSEENPADVNTPKYYVVSNLPEGTQVNVSVTGVPGTIVNKMTFEKTFTAALEKNHIATFAKIDDDGKPVWGEVNVKVTAEGAEPFDAGKRFIGNKGGAYQKRLKAFKDSVQGDYDKEVAEIREFITTLKNLQVEASRHVAQYKKDGGVASLKNKLKVEWDTFSKGAQPLLSQMDTNLKAKQAPDKQAKYHGRAFQDVSTSLAQLDQLIKAQGEKISGGTTTTNVDELDGLLQAGVQALEVWLAQAVSKTPFDSAPSDPGKAPQGASPAPAAGNAPAASSATPVPSGQAPAPAPAAAAASAPTLTPTPTAAPAPAPTPAPAAPSAVPAPSGGAEK